MEDFSRRVLIALVVAAAGPAAAMLVLLLVGPTMVAATAPETDGGILETVGSLLVGLLIGGMLPGAVRLGFGYAEQPHDRDGAPVPPSPEVT